MKIIDDLIGDIETALDKYKHEKYEGLELDEDIEQEIFNECQRFFESIKEETEELDSTIDTIIEETSEPSDYDYDMHEYESMRSRELRGV